jgi:fibronectin-binding autotransporter adhesin
VLTLGTGQTTGQITTISGDIADNAGSVSGASGQGALVIQGAGTVVLSDNNYTGGTTINGGVLELNSAQAPGTGTITFAANTDATLQIDNAALTSGALTNNNAIAGFTWGDGIDFRGLTYSGATVTYNSSTGQASVGGDTVTLSGGIPAGDTLVAVQDAVGGTEVELAQTATSEATLNSLIGAANAATSGAFTILINGQITESGALTTIALHSGVTLNLVGENGGIIDGNNSAHAGLIVSSGAVNIDNLTIQNARAQGATGTGNAGLGGGLFIGANGNVVLSNVNFSTDSADGGAGAAGGSANIGHCKTNSEHYGASASGTRVGRKLSSREQLAARFWRRNASSEIAPPLRRLLHYPLSYGAVRVFPF